MVEIADHEQVRRQIAEQQQSESRQNEEQRAGCWLGIVRPRQRCTPLWTGIGVMQRRIQTGAHALGSLRCPKSKPPQGKLAFIRQMDSCQRWQRDKGKSQTERLLGSE